MSDSAPPLASLAFLWPALAAASTGEFAAAMAKQFMRLAGPENQSTACAPDWASRNDVVLELDTMQLRDFSTAAAGLPTLICAPFTLHDSTIVDFAPGYSLVEKLCEAGLRRLYVTHWRSATSTMRFLSIDSYLADLNVAVDELGGRVDLIGACSGGWMALVYAARYPKKVRKLVLAGAPIDISAGESGVSRLAANLSMTIFNELVALGDGRILGHHILRLMPRQPLEDRAIRRLLDAEAASDPESFRALAARFREWYAFTVDLPGTYYLQVVEQLFKENRIARGEFVALGRRVDLSKMRAPVFLLAAREDELVAPAQIFATAHLIGTPPGEVRQAIAPCSHLSLFMGRRSLKDIWPGIAGWLMAPAARKTASRRKEAAGSAPSHAA